MKSNLYTLLLFSTILFTAGCKSAAKSYDKGNYEQAIDRAIKKLQKDPNDYEMKALLQDAYKQAIQNHEHNIAQIANNNNDDKWEWTYNEYNSMQQLADAVRRIPAASKSIKPADYSSSIATYKQKAGEVHLDKATQWMAQDEKVSYQRAYREYQYALRFIPGDIDIQQKMKQAYDAAVIHVAVEPVDRFRRTTYSNSSSQNIESDIIRYLQYNLNNDFVKFHSSFDARNNDIDQTIEIYYNQFNIGMVHDNRSSRQVSKDVVIKEIVYRKDSVVKEYGKVTANITTTQRTMRSEGSMRVNIRDNNGRIIWSDDFSGDHQWSTELVSYTGDERALSDADKNALNKKETYPPQENDIVNAINTKINSNLLYRLRDFYNRF